VLPSDSRHLRPGRRARRRTHLAAPERLESRELLTTSPLGFSLPDLTITGSVGNRAAWGGTLGVIATVINEGTSTITNPIAQAPGSLTTADAPASTVAIVITPRRSMAHAITIGTFQAPPVGQNSFEQIAESFTLPARPPGFAAPGHKFYVHLIVNSNGSVLESDVYNNVSAPIPVRVVSQALPELRATALDTQSPLEPGDTIVPTITITNLGTAPTSGPVEVALVASTTPSFTVGSSIVALYDIVPSIPGASQVPPGGVIAAFSQTANVPNNSYTFAGPAVTLPTSPAKYFLGVVVDPYGKISQLSTPKNALSQIQVVGPNNSGLPPAGVVSTGNLNLFPQSASGVFIGINPTATTTSSGTSSTKPSTLF
jgi:hypothetical protein